MSLPIRFWGRLLTSRILQFVALHDPDLIFVFSTPFILISWLLKHLYFIFSVKFDKLVSGYLAVNSFAFDSCINDLGRPLLANQLISDAL